MELRVVIGTNLYRRRVLKRYTQDYVGAEAGLAQGQISKIEKGERCLSLEAAIRLCTVLDCTLDDLLAPNELN